MLDNILWEVAADFVLLVSLANALDWSIGLAFFDSVDSILLLSTGVDNKILFSVPGLWSSLLLLILCRESVPLSKTDSWLIVRFIEFKFLVLWGSISCRTCTLILDFVWLGVTPNLSAQHTGSTDSCCSCSFNCPSSSLICH